MMRWIVRALGAVVAAGVLGVGSASARPVSLHLSFRSVGVAWSVSTTARYAFIEKPVGRDVGGTLVDEATGRRTTVVRSGCRYSAGPLTSSPWLLFDCTRTTAPGTTLPPPAPELYSLAAGGWTAVTPSPSIRNPCAPSTPSCGDSAQPERAGRYWIEYSVGNCPVGAHCSSRPEFQNLQTGAVQDQNPTSGRTILDLNALSLSQRLCSPLRVPRYYYIFTGFGPGSVVPNGKFAIALGTDNSGIGLVYLERCGTHLRQLLTKGPPYPDPPPPWAANRTSVVWQSARNELTGVFLSSLRRFTVRLPATALPTGCQAPDLRTCFTEIALTAGHLYLLGADGGLWTAKSPSAPKSKTTAPKR